MCFSVTSQINVLKTRLMSYGLVASHDLTARGKSTLDGCNWILTTRTSLLTSKEMEIPKRIKTVL